MLDSVPQLLNDAWIQIEVKGQTYGHQNPWPSGTVVRFADHLSAVGGQGFRKLGTLRGDEIVESYWTKLPFESRGIITSNTYSYADYNSQLDVIGGRLKKNIYMWYLVGFETELLWVRCDWLVPL